LTDDLRLSDPLPTVIRLPHGSLVILRHYDWPERAALARRLAKLCRARRLRFLVAGDIELAIAVGAGVHLAEGLVRKAPVKLRMRHRKRPDLLLTAAAHSRLALQSASRLGVDIALLSPVFPTLSHPGRPSLGLLVFRRLVRETSLAVFALGGISARTAPSLVGSGAVGVATIGGLGQTGSSYDRLVRPHGPPGQARG
jgi:thiamine-phosphate pyrophosphorylase